MAGNGTARSPTGRRPRILLVSDEEVSRRGFYFALDTAGYEVVEAASGRAAAGLLRAGPVDVVIVDSKLPEGGGLDLARRVLQDYPLVPVILLVGPVEPPASAGLFDCLVKPVGFEVITSSVTLAIEQRCEWCERQQTEASNASKAGLSLDDLDPGAALRGLLVIDVDGEILHVSPVAELMLGLQRGTLAGRPWTAFSALHAIGAALEPLAAPGQAAVTGLLDYVRPDGEHRSLEYRARRLTGSDRTSHRGAALDFHDLTRRRRLEAGISRADRLACLGALAASLAGEINNPMTVMLATLETLLADVTEPGVRERVQLLERSAWHCVNIIRTFSRVSASAEVTARPVVPGELVRDLLLLMGRELAVAKIEVDWKDGSVAPVLARPSDLRQALLDLVLHARDSMPDGGRLTLSTKEESGEIVIAVQDTGPGVAPDDLPRVFEAFLDPCAKSSGSGLGLSVCKSLIESQGGRLTAVSEPGLGSCFRLHLPARAALQDGTADAAGASSALDVLVVDPDLDALRLYSHMLRKQGCRPRIHSDPVQALMEFVPGRYDLAILDVRMPRISGFELARRLHEFDPVLPILFLTGSVLPEAQWGRGSENALGYMSKPFRSEALAHWLERLGKRPATQPEPPAERARVLVIDDDPDVCELVALALLSCGDFDVETETSPLDGLERARDSRPDVIVLDLMMPEIDGYETCRRLKTSPRTADIPVVVLSVASEVADVQRALSLGASQYVMKPFDPRHLATQLREAVRASRSGRLKLRKLPATVG